MHPTKRQRCIYSRRLLPLIALTIAVMTSSLASTAPAQAATAAYVYDALGRVKQVTYTDGIKITTITYSYDATGNRTSVVTSKNY